MDMVVCEECGAVVHPDFLRIHSDWHDSLTVVKPVPALHYPDKETTTILDC